MYKMNPINSLFPCTFNILKGLQAKLDSILGLSNDDDPVQDVIERQQTLTAKCLSTKSTSTKSCSLHLFPV